MNIRHENKSQPGMTTVESLRSRPPLERMLRIHQALQSGNSPTPPRSPAKSKSLPRRSSRHRVHARPARPAGRVQSGKNGYHYTEEVSAFPNIQITEGRTLRAHRRRKSASAISWHELRETDSQRHPENGAVAARHHFAQSCRHRADHFLPHPSRADFESRNIRHAGRAAAHGNSWLAYRKPGTKGSRVAPR